MRSSSTKDSRNSVCYNGEISKAAVVPIAGLTARGWETAALPAPEALACLTERELEVLALVAQGMSNGEIADQLVISPATAKTHVAHLLAKLDARDRVQLVILGYQSGLVKVS